MKKLLYHPESDCLYVGQPSGPGYDQGVLGIEASNLRAGSQIQVDLGVSVVLPAGDFETFSEAGYILDPVTGSCKGMNSQGKGGLPVVGTPVYAEHPSTEVLCFRYDLKEGRGRRPWYPGTPNPLDLFEHIRRGGLFEAWNVTFEWWIWNIVCVRKYGWPVLPLSQCRCAMAKSRRHSLPGKLDLAAKVLGTTPKHKDGHALVRKLTKPSKYTKKRPSFRWTPQNNWPDFLRLYDYCDGDVVAEDEASAMIPDLTPYEFATWQLDQTINARGVRVDMVALDAMLDILGQAERKYNDELVTLTSGAVAAHSELEKLKGWLADTQRLTMPNMQAETITDMLKQGHLTRPARRALEIRDILGSANVKKLRTLKLQVSSDGRLRDQYMYCGAATTGRASAGGVQLQNITAKGPTSSQCGGCGGIHGTDVEAIGCPRCNQWVDLEQLPDWTVEGVEFAIRDILTRDLAWVEHVWGDPIAVLCGCLRGLFIAKEGHDFICVDFSAVEAVVAACLARCQWRIDIFSTHGKIYEASASKATGIPLEDILEYKRVNKMHHPVRKKIGKVRELAGGYGGWIGAWKNFGADEFMNDDEIKTDILKWREESSEIVDMWGGQFRWCGPGKWDYRPELHGVEGCAIKAVLNPGQCFSHIDITYGVWDDILFCRLPSGRYLKYHRPRLSPGDDKLNRGPCYQITFEGYNSNSQKGPVGWHRLETYGGRLFENIVQATAADIQFDALKRVADFRGHDYGYDVVMHTHDEGTAEVPEGRGSVDEVVAIMSERPSWASWWPLRAAGWRHKRYQKD